MKSRMMKTYGVVNHARVARSVTSLFLIQMICLDATYVLRIIIQYVVSYLINLGSRKIKQLLYVWIVWDAMFVVFRWIKINTTSKIKKLFVLHAYVTSIMGTVKNAILESISTKRSYAQLKIVKLNHTKNVILLYFSSKTRLFPKVSSVRFAGTVKDGN